MLRPISVAVSLLAALVLTGGCSKNPPESLPASGTLPVTDAVKRVDIGSTDGPTAPAIKPHYYKRVVAVCIGIEKYLHVKSKAHYSENDATEVARVFREHYGFETVELIASNATRKATIETLENLKKELSDKDSLLVYFAGHGQVVDLPSFGSTGYLLPYEADLDLNDTRKPEEWAERAIDMRELLRMFVNANAQHVTFVVDACCSGFMTRRGSAEFPTRSDLQVLMGRRSRAVLAASAERRPSYSDNVTGHGYFTGPFLRAIQGDKATSTTEIFITVRRETIANSNRAMEPQRGEFGNELGEFVFIPKSIEPGAVEVAVRAAQKVETDRTARRTQPGQLLETYDADSYRLNPNRVELEKEWLLRLERFHENAGLGDPLAMTGASLCLARGLGIDEVTERTNRDAYKLAKRAFESGHPIGKFALGVCFMNGTGVEKNPAAGRELLAAAVADGVPLARLALADLLLADQPAADAVQRATQLLEQAEKDGLVAAVPRLASLAVKQNPQLSAEEAVQWLKRLEPAAKAGSSEARYRIYDLLADTLNAQLTDEGREGAFTFLLKAAEAGHIKAQYWLACEYYRRERFKGRLGRTQDFHAARKWAKLAADAGHFGAMSMVATIYLFGHGVESNLPEANAYYNKAATTPQFHESDWPRWYRGERLRLHGPELKSMRK